MVDNLLVVLICYNRLDFTKKTLRYFWATVSLPYYLVVVDNASTDGTGEYLTGLQKRGRIDKVMLNPENYYPGKACNIGWAEGLKEYPSARFLMRLDNDMELHNGWDVAAMDYFKRIPSMGQVGIDHEAIENEKADGYLVRLNGKVYNPFPGCIGGPSIIRRLVYDKGARYSEEKWTSMEKNVPTIQEDFRFSADIKNMGFLIGHMTENLARTFANKDNWYLYPDYYRQTMKERGYDDLIEDVLGGADK